MVPQRFLVKKRSRFLVNRQINALLASNAHVFIGECKIANALVEVRISTEMSARVQEF
jgi:hypothetical protein